MGGGEYMSIHGYGWRSLHSHSEPSSGDRGRGREGGRGGEGEREKACECSWVGEPSSNSCFTPSINLHHFLLPVVYYHVATSSYPPTT